CGRSRARRSGKADRLPDPFERESALLIVDVQKDFCEGGSLEVPGGDAVVPALNRYAAAAEAAGVPVYASRDWHPAITRHFREFGGEWPEHCVQHRAGAEFHDALRLPHATILVTKGGDPAAEGYSAFEGRTPDGRSLLDDLN